MWMGCPVMFTKSINFIHAGRSNSAPSSFSTAEVENAAPSGAGKRLALPAPQKPPQEDNMTVLDVVAPTEDVAVANVSTPMKCIEDVKSTVEEKPQTNPPEVPEVAAKPTRATESNIMLEKALNERDMDKKQGRGGGMKRPAAATSNAGDQKTKEKDATPKPKAKAKAKAKCKQSKPAAVTPKPKAGGKEMKLAVKPKAKAKAMKKPAGKPKHNLGPIPARAKRLKLQPHGCSKCRYVSGCCDSCWVYRGYIKV